MKSKRTILPILIIIAIMIPEARAITPQSQTVKITDTHDDMFITEIGIGIDSSLVTIKDPGMDIRAFLVFRELEINYWEPLKNATLRLHTSNTLSFDADSSITVYGMALSDLQLEGYLIPSTVLSIGFTSAFTNYNTSEFYGNQWHEINVTSIVEELIRNANWDGDGSAGTETGDTIGFHIVGDEGDDKRYFYDFKVGNGLEAQLVIHWNHEPPPPTGGGEFNQTYRGYDIWSVTGKEILTEEFYTWANPDGKITLVNDYLVDMVDYSWDSWYPNGGYHEYYLERKEDIERYSESVEIRFYSKIVQEYFIEDRPDWEPIRIEDPDDTDATGFYHYIDPGSSSGAHDYHFQMNNVVYINTISYTSTGQEWWTSYKRNSTKVYLSTWNGETEPDWENDPPDQSDDNALVSDGNFTELRIAKSMEGPSTNVGNIDYRMGYFTILIDDVAILNNTFTVTDENGTTVQTLLDDLDDAFIFIDDILEADPEDPDPPGEEWDETGPFTRFRTRFYILLMGFGLIFGPLFYFAMRRPSGYEFVIGLFIMLVGYSFLRAAAGI